MPCPVRRTLSAALPAFIVAVPALAQDERTAPRWTPDDTIIVTGTRRPGYTAGTASVSRVPVPLTEIPQSIQVITRDLIEDQQLNFLDEVLRNVSGVVPSLSSEIVLANPIVRGFEAEIFTDGLIGYGDTAVSDPASLLAYDRVEVAKGPTSTLYGGGTGAPVGGLINLVSALPQPGHRLRLRGRAGSFNLLQIGGDANVELAEGLSARVIGDYRDGGDPIDGVRQERLFVSPAIRAVLPGGTDISALFRYDRTEQLEYTGLPAEIADVPGVPQFRFSGASDAPETVIENLTADFSVRQPIADGVSAALRVRRYENDFEEVSSFPFLAVLPGTGTTFPIITGQLPNTIDEWTVDASVTGQFTTGPLEHAALLGVQYDDVDFFAASGFDLMPIGTLDYADPASDLAFGEIPPLTTFLENRYETVAVYAHDQITAFDRVHLLVSLRYSELTITEALGGAGNDITYTEFDPRVGLTVDVTDGVSLFGGYATGSRLSLFFNNPGLAPLPERSESFEAGVKLALTEIGLTGTIAAYDIERTNVPTPDPTTFFTSIQTGRQRSQGVEADLIWEPTAAISLLATYAYTDAEVREDTLIPVGDGLPRVPEHQGRFAARYRVLDGPLLGLGIGAGVTAASAAELTLPNSFESDSYAAVDAQVSYETGPARLGLRVENILGEDYFIPYQFLAQAVVRPGNPRAAFVTLDLDF
ncbi:MAG: TonB-dependent siderophore receptor [Pseudomonadota bacterium]